MPDPPAYDPVTQSLITHLDIDGNVESYEVVDKGQVEMENDEDFLFLRTFMNTPKAEVTQLQALLAIKAHVRLHYRMSKVD